jgi:predicted DNA-binding WGR domain protein
VTLLPVLPVRRDPACGMARFHALRVAPDLLGGWTLVREWGRVGSPGRVRVDASATEYAAVVELERLARRKRGYAGSRTPPTAVNTDRPGCGRA